uniref:Uncharacterized protein n=1 Tax=Arundo donax TaxID=35708 RepID=A0A0A9D0D9_ARUDO
MFVIDHYPNFRLVLINWRFVTSQAQNTARPALHAVWISSHKITFMFLSSFRVKWLTKVILDSDPWLFKLV